MGKRSHQRHGQISMRRMVRTTLGPCHFCGYKAGTIDHLIPTSRGGADDATNFVSACLECNHLKNDMTPAEFFAFCKELLVTQPVKYLGFLQKARVILARNIGTGQ